MPDRIRLITPQNESVTSSLSLQAKWVRTYEENDRSEFDESGLFTNVVTREGYIGSVFSFLGLQLAIDTGSTPEGYSMGEDCVPSMTAEITDGVVVSDSGNIGIGYEGWRAFDKNSETRWSIASTSGTVAVEFETEKIITGYAIRARNDAYLIDSPKDWTFEGSSDGVVWTILDSQSNFTNWSMNERKEFSLPAAENCRFFRLNFLSNQSGTELSVSEIELLEGIPYGFGYHGAGNRLVGPIALSGKAYGDEIVHWTSGPMPSGTIINIGCALTEDMVIPSNFIDAVNGAQCPVITENEVLTGKYLWIRQELFTTDTAETPSLLSFEMQLVLDANADMTIEIDRTTLFSGMNYRSNTVSALPCGEMTSFEPYDVYDGFLYWRARAVNTLLGIDTGWSTPNSFNLMGGPFPLPRYLTLIENRKFGKLRDRRTLYLNVNRSFGKKKQTRTLYLPENRAFGRLRRNRVLYTELNVTDDSPYPWIGSISTTRGQPGSVITLTGSGFGYNHTVADLGNPDRYVRCYGGGVYLNNALCSVLEWTWTKITFQIPSDAETGPISVQLLEPVLRKSNTIGFEVYSGIPTDDVGIELFLCDRNTPNIIVKQLDGAWGKVFQMIQNNPGSGSFKISRYDAIGGNQDALKDENFILVKLDGNPLFKWIIESRRPNIVDPSEQQVIEVSGRGVLSMLNWAVVYPEQMGTPELDRRFIGTASTILRSLILEAQSRGGLKGVTIGWENDEDALGNRFSETINLSFHVGTPILEVATKFSDGLGYFDIEMTPELMLKIYKSRGVDLSESIIYRPGQAMLSHQNENNASELVNEVLVEGGEKQLAIASHSQSQSKFGRREGYLSASNVDTGLSEYGQAYLNRVAFPKWGVQGIVTKFYDDEGNSLKPFVTFLIGDWIGWYIPPEGGDAAGFDGRLRVKGITVQEENDTGELKYTLELNNMILEHDIKLNQKVERMSQYSGSDILSVSPSSSGGYSTNEVNQLIEALNTSISNKSDIEHDHEGVYSEQIHSHPFIALDDTPDTYQGNAMKVVAVNSDATGLEFITAAGGGGEGIGAVTELPLNPTNGQAVFMFNENYQYLAVYYGPKGKWYRVSLVGSNYPWTSIYKPEALFNLLFGDATKNIVEVNVSTDFNTALRIKGATNTTKQLTWTFSSGAGDFAIWVGCESESNYDYAYIYIDDVDISGRIQGNVVSRYITKTLVEGSHTLKITYRKDGSGDTGYDGVQVYAVSIP